MKRREALAGLGLVSVAGCLRLSSSQEDATNAPTSTPGDATDTPPSTSKPSTVTDEPDVPYPTGLSESGITEFLFASHSTTLQETSFRSQWQKTDLANSHVKWQKEYRADSGNAMGQWVREYGGPVEIFRTQESGLWREELGDRYTYGDDGPTAGLKESLWQTEIRPLIAGAEWSQPERTNDSRPAVWTVTSDTVASPSRVPGYHQGELLSISSASMDIDENGVIRSVTALYKIRDTIAGELTYESTFQLDSIGEVSLDSPSWVETARNNVPTVSASLTDDKRMIRVQIESGNAIEADSRFSVFDTESEAKFIVKLDEPVDPGESAYLYTDSISQDFSEGSISRGSRPESTDAALLENQYQLTALRKTTRYLDRVSVA